METEDSGNNSKELAAQFHAPKNKVLGCPEQQLDI